MPTAPCAIWDVPAEQQEKAGDFEVFDSPRAGGKYWISGTAIGVAKSLTNDGRRLLTTYLCEQRHSGVPVPRINANFLELLKSRLPIPVAAKFPLAMRFIGRHIKILGDYFDFGDNPATLRFMAETECQNAQEASSLIKMLQETGYLEGTFNLSGTGRVRPTMGGWTQIEQLTRPKIDSSQAFVAMWFSDSMTDAYVNGIAPAISASGYKPIRIDKKEHINKIDDEIIAEIRRSRFLVADFTCEPKIVRGGVYYEAGFAQGIGIPVIWTCNEKSINDLHFDTRQYAHIVWKAPSDLFEQLKNRIGATNRVWSAAANSRLGYCKHQRAALKIRE
jgi:hypothetical protein